jgi:cation diffusion facilitator family transporter
MNENTLISESGSRKQNRNSVIIRTSILGIAANLILAALKCTAGLFANSIAFILDGINNVSDSLSSLVTIIGIHLASKQPDKEHPLGHGRIEYLSALIVAVLVLYAGITSLIESAKKIFNPSEASYTKLSLAVIITAIFVKLLMGTYVKKQGKKVNSTALTASGTDAFFDAVLSLSVLICALISIFTDFSAEPWTGILISIFISNSGIQMIRETVNDILGKRADKETTIKIKKLLTQEPQVKGAYDLVIHNYGPDKNYASVHLELPDTMTVAEVDVLTRHAEEKIFKETGIILTGVGVYSHNTKDEKITEMQNKIFGILNNHNWALQMHGFYADNVAKTLRFDVVLSFEIKPAAALEILMDEVQQIFPDYEISITPDVDISD